MNLAAMRLVVARLLTDRGYQRRFFAARPEEAPAHGLTAEEFRVLAALDPRALGITTEGYAGKRLERVESAFPRTLRALDAVDRGARRRYLQGTAFAPTDAEERATFHRFVHGAVPDRDRQRFLDDLADLEALLYQAPPPKLPSYRYRPEATRPRPAPGLLRLRARGPLDTFLDGPPPPPGAYPDAPGEVLVHRDGSRIVCEPLAGATAELLAACDGTRTVADLVARLGPEAEARLRAWFKLGAVEEA